MSEGDFTIGALPALPPDWEIVPLGEVASVRGGKRMPKGRPFATHKTPYPYIRVSDLKNGTVLMDDLRYVLPEDQEGIRRYTISAKDLYITIAGTLGEVGIVPVSLDGAQLTENAAKIANINFSRLDQRYLVSWLASDLGQRQIGMLKGVGAGVPKLALFRIESVAVGLPPLGEQKKIASILSSVDAAIDATQSVIDQIQVVKKAMMAELLTRGLPGRHTRFKQTEIGEVPEEWEVGPLRDFSRLTSGGTPSRESPQFWGGGVAWVKTGEINYNVITETEETISVLGVENSAAKMLPAGSLLMAMYGQGRTRGRVALLGIEATVNQACLGILPKPNVLPAFLFQYFTHKYEDLRVLGNEGTQKNLNAGLVGDVSIAVPLLDEQRAIVAALDSVRLRAAAEEEVQTQLSDLKSALMSVLLTGEVRVNPEQMNLE